MTIRGKSSPNPTTIVAYSASGYAASSKSRTLTITLPSLSRDPPASMMPLAVSWCI